MYTLTLQNEEIIEGKYNSLLDIFNDIWNSCTKAAGHLFAMVQASAKTVKSVISGDATAAIGNPVFCALLTHIFTI